MYALEGQFSSMARVVTINSVGHTNNEVLTIKNIGDNIVGAHYLPTRTIEHLRFNKQIIISSSLVCFFTNKQSIL